MSISAEIKHAALSAYFDQNMDTSAIIIKFGVNINTLNTWIRRDSRSSKPTAKRKTKSYKPEDRVNAATRHLAGEKKEDLAKEYGCHVKSILDWTRAMQNKRAKKAQETMFPELESMRKQMFDILQQEFISLTALLESTEQKRQYVHKKMTLLGEHWNT